MKGLWIFFACFAFVRGQEAVEEKLRLLRPFLMLTDELFEVRNDNQCLDKLFCLLETDIADGIDNPLKHVSRFLTNAKQDTDSADFQRVEFLIKEYPQVSRILNSIRLGQNGRKSQVCSDTFFKCEAPAASMIASARTFDDASVNEMSNHFQNAIERRGLCNYIRAGCTGLKFGCGVCAIFTFGSCGVACGPVAGGACTASKLACAIHEGLG